MPQAPEEDQFARFKGCPDCANLAGAVRVLDNSFDLPETARMLDAALDQSMDFCYAERGAIVIIDEKGSARLAIRLDSIGNRIPSNQLALTDYLIARTVERETPVWLDPSAGGQPGEGAWGVCIPLRNRARVFGVLYLENGTAIEEFRTRCCCFIEHYVPLFAVAAQKVCNCIHYVLPDEGGDPAERAIDCGAVLRRPSTPAFDHIIGCHPSLVRLLKLVAQVAESDAPVLVQGESGTGKELIAHALHVNSNHRNGFFLALNCAALPEGILESELFGYQRGAFTGAVKDKVGLLEQANGGTLFLDEIGDMPPALQVKLLRVLQTRDYVPVGATRPRKFDARLVAATTRDLAGLVESGEFRVELLHRLNVIELVIPPLRDRVSDIPLLAQHFLKTYGEKYCKQYLSIAPDAIEALIAYEFPGNVRELESIVHRAVILSEGRTITRTDLPQRFGECRAAGQTRSKASQAAMPRSFRESKKKIVEEFEREFIVHALRAAQGNISDAARQSGINIKNFYVKMRGYGIDPLRYRLSGSPDER